MDFGTPFATGVKEVVVTGPGAPSLGRLEDLSGVEVFVQPSSSYRESLEALNARLRGQGLEPVTIRAASERLEAEDILELVQAGSVAATVVDDHLASFWSGVFDRIRVHQDLVLREGGELAWACAGERHGSRPRWMPSRAPTAGERSSETCCSSDT